MMDNSLIAYTLQINHTLDSTENKTIICLHNIKEKNSSDFR